MSNNESRLRLSCSMLVAVILFLAGTIAAQIGNTGTVLGTVMDSSGAVVPGVSVSRAVLRM